MVLPIIETCIAALALFPVFNRQYVEGGEPRREFGMFRVFLIVTLSLLSACASQGELPNWVPIDSSRFPLEISSVAFPSGYAIGQTTGVTLPNTNWTIRFPLSGPVLATSPASDEINISPLSCVSGSAEAQPCYLRLNHIRGQVPVCELVTGALPGQRSGSSTQNVICPDLWTRSG